MVPGEVLAGTEPVPLNAGREPVRLTVRNTARHPVLVGSHHPFAEVNAELEFDRGSARGLRLHVPAGTTVRFDPGVELEVDLVPFGGLRPPRGTGGVSS
ncbi:ABC transporter permease [Wenjunlia vitaminophila]|uniref:ABC transporter permease n=1 Tax=Wenjunlia vitaminophila TaxID=76728 RepID=A0A0T6LUQ5_WENVI|nr:urease subunit beta [Wenjunlia vitaminophila]KRV49781.1 ABC transporter permease [Wenjunlia vitaminophila]